MLCKKCSKEIEENAPFCLHCGTLHTGATPAEAKNTTDLFYSFFGGTNFHIITLFYLVSVCASVCAGLLSGSFVPPIFQVLLLFALFKLKALAKQNAPLSKFASPIKIFRVIIKIEIIFTWIVTVLFGFFGFFMLFSGSSLAGGGVADATNSFLVKFSNFNFVKPFASLFGGITLTLLAIILIFVAAFEAFLVIFVYGSFYKTTKCAELSAKTGALYLPTLNSVSVWLIINSVVIIANAIISFDSGITALLNIVSVGFYVATLLLAAKTIKNILDPKK